MYEVLTRRFKRTMGDDPAWARPDLLVIDGGKGQLGMAVTALTDLGVKLGGDEGIEVIGLAKERELEAGSAPDRIYRRNVKDSIALRANSPELYVLARIRDEAHRFANTFHRDRRTKLALRSELDAIPGIGATRRQRLLKHFGSVRAVRLASVDELAKAPGMNKKAATQVAKYFADVAAAESQATPSAEYEGDESGDMPAASAAAAQAAAAALQDDARDDSVAATLDENVEGLDEPNAANAESLAPEADDDGDDLDDGDDDDASIAR